MLSTYRVTRDKIGSREHGILQIYVPQRPSNDPGIPQVGLAEVRLGHGTVHKHRVAEISPAKVCLGQATLPQMSLTEICPLHIGFEQTAPPQKGGTQICVAQVIRGQDGVFQKEIAQVSYKVCLLCRLPGIPGGGTCAEHLKVLLLGHTLFLLSDRFIHGHRASP